MFFEQYLLKDLSVAKVQTISDWGEGTHVFIGIVSDEMFAKLFNDGEIFIQAAMEFWFLKATIQFKDVIDKIINLKVVEIKVSEKVPGNT